MRFNKITRISDYFGIDVAHLESAQAINAILEYDSRYFIDPLLLSTSEVEIIRTAGVSQLSSLLGDVFRLLRTSKREDDPAWKGAGRLLHGKEFAGIGLGYGGTRTTGSNLDARTFRELLRTAKEVIDLGVEDPDIFLMMPLLVANIGADTISDITANAIKESLAQYTQDVLGALPGVLTEKFQIGVGIYELPRHPFQKKRGPIILVAKDIVAELPVAADWSEVADVSHQNQEIRERFDRIALSVFKRQHETNAQRKANARESLRTVAGFATELTEIISELRKGGFGVRREPGLVALTRYADDPRLTESQFSNPSNPSTNSEAYEFVLKIVSDFKFLIEERRMASLLFDSNGRPFREDISQKLFFMVAYSHCKAWNLDITPEAETGNGPVDFKFSMGFDCRIAVEIKLSTNPNAVHGYESQLKRYMDGEQTERGIFILIDVGAVGQKMKKISRLADAYQAHPVYIDAKHRDSASKSS